jgi:hypothetical protein
MIKFMVNNSVIGVLLLGSSIILTMMMDPAEGFSSSATKKSTNIIQQQQPLSHRNADIHNILYSSITGDDEQLYSPPSSFLEKTPQATPYMANQRLYERIADQILDVVLTPVEDDDEFLRMLSDEESLSKKQVQHLKKQYQELQVSLIEQLSKIMTASGKTLWSQARMRSGVLPSGRTVLGTIIDPFNLFTERSRQQSKQAGATKKKSKTSSGIAEEDRSVTLTRQLVSLLHQHGGDDNGNQNPMIVSLLENLPSPSELSRTQIVAFSRILSGKIWDRRVELVGASQHFWKQMLSLQAARTTKTLAVKSGERLLQGIPPKVDEEEPERRKHETDRLQAARNFLEYYQSDDAEDRAFSSVKTTL